jgi:hypothetical protein
MPIIPATQEVEVGESWSEASPIKKQETLSETLKQKDWDVAQVVDHLSIKCKALSSNCSTAKKKKEMEEMEMGLSLGQSLASNLPSPGKIP